MFQLHKRIRKILGLKNDLQAVPGLRIDGLRLPARPREGYGLDALARNTGLHASQENSFRFGRWGRRTLQLHAPGYHDN